MRTFEVDPGLVIDYARAFEVPQQIGARAQLVHAAIEAGIAGGALSDARWFVRAGAPVLRGGPQRLDGDGGRRPARDPRFGRLATQVRAAETVLADAAAVQDAVGRARRRRGSRPRLARGRAGEGLRLRGRRRGGLRLFSLTGASADEKHDLSRHWRNARTHSSHDPVDWKYHHVGNWLLNGVLPPNHGQL